MSKGTRRVIGLFLALSLALLPSFVELHQASADSACQCTTFVYNYEGSLPANYPNAKDWGSYLQNAGWHTDAANVGDIAVFPAYSYLGNIQMSGSGHVGVVTAATYNGNHQWTITLRSANLFGQTYFDQSGCTNVSLVPGAINDTVVAFYTAYPYAPQHS